MKLQEDCYLSKNQVKLAKLAIERGLHFSTQRPCFDNWAIIQVIRRQQQTRI
jgi:hypothetical protein